MNFKDYTYSYLCENRYLDKVDDASSIKEVFRVLLEKLLAYSNKTRKQDKLGPLNKMISILNFRLKEEHKREDESLDIEAVKKSFRRFLNSRTKNEYYFVAMYKKIRDAGFLDNNKEWN